MEKIHCTPEGLFDEKCLDLAEYFYPGASEKMQRVLAKAIQQLVEDFGEFDLQTPQDANR